MPDRPLTSSMFESAWPEEVKSLIRSAPPPPRPDPTLGIAIAPKPVLGRPANRFVTIGDSLTHGFKSGAIHDTHLAWPVTVAWEMGWDDEFRRPTYSGFGGLPMNIEWLLHELEGRYGDRLSWWEMARAAFTIRGLLDELEDWWERGKGSVVPRLGGIVHNLSVYGWDPRDAIAHTADFSRTILSRHAARDNLFKQIVENASEIAALRVLESAVDANGKALTPVEAAAELGRHGGTLPDGSTNPDVEGIEMLVVLLGANNVLGSVLRLGRPAWSGEHFRDLEKKSAYSVWLPSHFASEYDELVAGLSGVHARHVIVATVPHVTIPPITRGLGGKVEPGSRYFPYYSRPWVSEERFNPMDDPHLTAREARAIDSVIDAYNDKIESVVRAKRLAGQDWYLLDICGILDRLASRRYQLDPAARPDWWTPYELPPLLAALQPPFTSRFFRSGPEGRTEGGIFSLDGVHPTTVGYGIIAQEVIRIMERAGVTFYFGDGVTVRPTPINVDFERLLRLDTLMRSPPRCIDQTLGIIGWLDEAADVFRRMLPRSG